MSHPDTRDRWIQTLTLLLIFFMGVAAVEALICIGQALGQAKTQYTCSSPVPYKELLVSFQQGNLRLDADHDGRPCENKA